jgi:SAM-dependent methyltransferase/glycosyltransferase involved in cell wall biosynthesis
MVVVDNSAGNPAVEGICRNFGARLVVECRSGLNRARNAGAKAARGRWIAFIDDDAVADPEWLARHLARLCNGGVAATSGRVLPLALDTDAQRRFAATGGFDLGREAFELDRSNPDWFEMTNFGGVAAASNMVLSRELFENGWRFDPDLGIGAGIQGEEHYAFFSIVRDGNAVAYVPGAVVRHPLPETDEELTRRIRRTLVNSSAYLMMLAIRERGFRRRALTYGLTSLSGRRRQWRAKGSAAGFGGRGDRLRAVVGGAILCARMLIGNAGPMRRLREWARRRAPLVSAYYLLAQLRVYRREAPAEIRGFMEEKYAGDTDPWKYGSASHEIARYDATLDLLDAWRSGQQPAAFEVGCGEGLFTRRLAERCSSVLAVDIVDVALERAQQGAANLSNVRFMRWDGVAEPPPGRFDLVVCMDVIDSGWRRSSQRRLIRSVAAAIEPGGLLIVSSVLQNPIVERAWWARRLGRGAAGVLALIESEEPALRRLETRMTETHVLAMYER